MAGEAGNQGERVSRDVFFLFFIGDFDRSMRVYSPFRNRLPCYSRKLWRFYFANETTNRSFRLLRTSIRYSEYLWAIAGEGSKRVASTVDRTFGAVVAKREPRTEEAEPKTIWATDTLSTANPPARMDTNTRRILRSKTIVVVAVVVLVLPSLHSSF